MDPFQVVVPASASNFGSGFDTLSAALSLHLEVSVFPEEGDQISIRHLEGDVPEPDIFRAALEVALEFLEVSPPGLRLEVDNPIPLQRGLGSSGAAIIAGIRIAETLAGVDLSFREVMALAMPLEGHPDNLAASLRGGWVLSLDREGKVETIPIESSLDCRFLVAVPPTRISTAEARRILPSAYSLEEAVFGLQRVALLVHSLNTGDVRLIREALRDRVHQPYRARLIEGAEALLEYEDLPADADRSLLGLAISGSGSSMVALVRGDSGPVQQWMSAHLHDGTRFLKLDLDRQGGRTFRHG